MNMRPKIEKVRLSPVWNEERLSKLKAILRHTIFEENDKRIQDEAEPTDLKEFSQDIDPGQIKKAMKDAYVKFPDVKKKLQEMGWIPPVIKGQESWSEKEKEIIFKLKDKGLSASEITRDPEFIEARKERMGAKYTPAGRGAVTSKWNRGKYDRSVPKDYLEEEEEEQEDTMSATSSKDDGFESRSKISLERVQQLYSSDVKGIAQERMINGKCRRCGKEEYTEGYCVDHYFEWLSRKK
jgi:hypothetical protein